MKVKLMFILMVSWGIFQTYSIIVLQNTEVPNFDGSTLMLTEQPEVKDNPEDVYYYDENQPANTQPTLDLETCTQSTCDSHQHNQQIGSNVPKNTIESSARLEQSSALQPHRIGKRQTLIGTMCAATYVFEGQTYDDCFIAPNGKEYCKTDVSIVRECEPLPPPPTPEPEPEPEKQSNIQPEPEPEPGLVRYTVSGKVCKFPMVYKGTVYNDCIDTQNNRKECFVDGKWEKCRPINVNRFLTDGRRCQFPFIYNDLQQYDCVKMPDEQDYCKIDGAWQQCVSLAQEENEKNDGSFTGVERLNNLVNDPQNEQQIQGLQGSDEKPQNNSTVVVVSILLVVVVVGIVLAVIFILRKKKNNDNQQDS
eukprot:TRINITY_DN20057_c0_g1_i1.p1 TRINITY_DN20057_c0_g1~~TRINITY_DN20057_c0_g1_i1.p1  ORF type:complete len:364 (-),score=39.67 TRINITY_DN20057_c0_g1_i1:105-1196(-)